MKVAVIVALVALVFFFVFRSRADLGDGEARKLLAEGAALIDVRSPSEFASGHVSGAKNVPVDQLGARLDEIPRDKPVLLYCRSGARSARAVDILRKAGFDQVHNIGSMPSW